MAKSDLEFNRWKPILKSTWSFQVFNKYNDEINNFLWANKAVTKQTYVNLHNSNAKWEDLPSNHLIFDVPKGQETFKSLKEWSDTYNNFNNWTNLNALLALSSNLETYLATVINLALDSDPGVLFESSKSIDGIVLLKHNAKRNKFQEEIITSITKGDWNSRTSSFEKVFGQIPFELKNNIGNLEKIRTLRNKIGHSFGRDIEESRKHEVKDILQMEKLSDSKLKKYQYAILDSVKSIDKYLLLNHIGEFQRIAFYHRLYPTLKKELHRSERAIILKKELGKYGDTSGKVFCKGLVNYYEEL